MHPNERRIPAPSNRPADIRRQVLDMAADGFRDSENAAPGAALSDSARDPGYRADLGDRAAIDLYLALLQDCLPVYVTTMADLDARAGHGSVHGNLLPVARATIEFYREILSVKIAAFTRPTQIVRLRQLMRSRGLGPGVAHDKVSSYLTKERDLGRVAADADPPAAAHLLLGGCVNYAFSAMLMGDDDLSPLEDYVDGIVRGLRLAPEPPPVCD